MELSAELGDGPDVAQDNQPLLYNVHDKPNWLLSIFLAIQHYVTTFGGLILLPFYLGPALCLIDDDPSLGYLISSIFMVTGISTLLQVTLGIRLPIIQGPSIALTACIVGYLKLPQWNCPSQVDLYSMGTENRTAEWQDRMLEIQGAVISVAFIKILIGYTGLIGWFLRCVSPLTIAPTITLVGVSLIQSSAWTFYIDWYTTIGTFVLVLMFSQWLRNVRTPIVCYSLAKGWYLSWIKGFQLFSVFITIFLVCVTYWIISEIQNTDDPTTEYLTHVPPQPMNVAQWFSIPYPFQWGMPRFTLDSILAMLAAVIVDIVNSVSDYYACASICGKPPPKKSAIKRGIGIEGVGTLIAGIYGIGPGISSMSENIGTIGITKVGNRRVVIFGAIIMIILSVFGKVGALFALIPTTILYSLTCIMASFVCSVGLSHLQYLNLKSHRNLFVLGSAMFFGLAIPAQMATKPAAFDTGFSLLDEILFGLLSTTFFVGFCLSLLLDNILPGTPEERGMVVLPRDSNESAVIYDLPQTNYLKKAKKTGLYIAVTTCTR